MKKILAVLALIGVSTSALADGYHGHPYHGYRPPVIHEYHSSTGDVLLPMVIGGVVGYVIAQPKQQPVVVQQVPAGVNVNEPIYQYQVVHDAACDCDKRVLVKIN